MKKTFTKLLLLLGAFLFLGAGDAWAVDYYLSGSFNGWGQTYQMQEFGDAYGIFLQKIPGGTEFRFIRKNGTVTYIGANNENYNIDFGYGNDSHKIYSNNINSTTSPSYIYKATHDIESMTIYLKFNNNNKSDTKPSVIEIYLTADPPTGTPKNMYILGHVNNTNFDASKALPMTSTASGIFTYKGVNINNADDGNGYFSFIEFKPNSNDWNYLGTRYTAPSYNLFFDTWSNCSSSNEILMGTGEYNYKLPEGKYDIEVNLNTKTVKATRVEFPDKMYIYGHLNNQYWVLGNYVEMTPTNTPGVYTATDVDVSGFWGEADVLLNSSRIKYESTDDENYIAFFDHIVEDMSKQGTKYGSDGSNPPSGDSDSNTWIHLENINDVATAPTIYRNASNTHNYCVDEGIYDIEFNFTNMTVKFIKKAKKIVNYNWFVGIDKWELQSTNEGNKVVKTSSSVRYDSKKHIFTYGEDNILQVGVGTNPEHIVARQAVFTVKYREPDYKKDVKRRAADKNRDEEGYYLVSSSGSEYDQEGDDGHDNNPYINLNAAGDYKITATLTDDPHEDVIRLYNTEGINNPTATLLVSVAPASLNTTAKNMETTFKNNSDGFVFGSVDLGQTGLEYGTDFIMTIEPVENEDTGTWAKIADYSSESDVEAAYKSLLTDGGLFAQYQQTAAEGVVDGLYTEVSKLNASAASSTSTTYDLSASFPCSGIYTLTVKSVNTNYTFDDIVVTVTVEPNLDMLFGSIADFNINGYGFTVGATSTIEYPTSEATSELLKSSVAYKPGIYFDSEFTVKVGDDGEVNEGRRTNGNTSWIGFDFSALADANQNVYVTLKKNGTSAVKRFLVQKSTTVPTGVETIEAAEEGEAVYYNLQGVKVANPQHGIFVKVAGGKAEKVVL